MQQVTGLVPPIVTPLIDGRLDLQSLHRMLDELAGHVAGVLVGGSVGEVASLTVEERITLMREAAAHLDGQGCLAVSIADNSIENSRRLSEAAAAVDADLLVVSAPNYYTNDRSMLVRYFGLMSRLASTDLCLYDNPVATHTRLSVEDIRALVEAARNLSHIKVTDRSLDKVEALCRDTSLVVLSGDDAVLWHQLLQGARGAMVALPLVYPAETDAFYQRFQACQREEAAVEYRRMTHFIHAALGADDYVPVLKAVLHHKGVLSSEEARPPLVGLSRERYREVMESL